MGVHGDRVGQSSFLRTAWTLTSGQPITFTTTILRSGGFSRLSSPTIATAVRPPANASHASDPSSQCMFLIHYAHRAVISPLILAPKRSPQHIWVTSASVFFNLLNGYMIGALRNH